MIDEIGEQEPNNCCEYHSHYCFHFHLTLSSANTACCSSTTDSTTRTSSCTTRASGGGSRTASATRGVRRTRAARTAGDSRGAPGASDTSCRDWRHIRRRADVRPIGANRRRRHWPANLGSIGRCCMRRSSRACRRARCWGAGWACRRTRCRRGGRWHCWRRRIAGRGRCRCRRCRGGSLRGYGLNCLVREAVTVQPQRRDSLCRRDFLARQA